MAQDATEQPTETNETNEPTAPPEPAAPTGPQEPAQDAKPGTDTPPWERDGQDFSPEKAWSLIRHLREDNQRLKTAGETSAAKLREYEDARLSETERLQRDLREARQQLADTARAQAWAEARANHPCLTADDLELIGGTTPEQIKANAARLAARIDAQAASHADQNTINPLLRAKPTGGTDPTDGERTDWARRVLTDK